MAAEVGEPRMIQICEDYLAYVREKRAGIPPPLWSVGDADSSVVEQGAPCLALLRALLASGGEQVPATPPRSAAVEALRALRGETATWAPSRPLRPSATPALRALACPAPEVSPAARLWAHACTAGDAAPLPDPPVVLCQPLLAEPAVAAVAEAVAPCTALEVNQDALLTALESVCERLKGKTAVRTMLEKRLGEPDLSPEIEGRLKSLLQKVVPEHPLFCDLHQYTVQLRTDRPPPLSYSRNNRGEYSTFAPCCNDCEKGQAEEHEEKPPTASLDDDDLYA